MRPPEFWNADARGRDAAHTLRALLTPLSWAYAWVGERRIRTAITRHAPIPVICVGNLTIGGAGKTPLARALRKRLGAGAHILSRGYGGRLAGPLRVTPDMETREVGDEPLLHAADGDAWIARDRVAGALAAANAGARALILDDGFQNPSLGKDLSFLAIDAGFGIGNGAVFPAGPLRERVAEGLKRADAIIMLDGSAASLRQAQGSETQHLPEPVEGRTPSWLAGFKKPILHAYLEPTGAIPSGPLVAFAGIARPQKFFDTLAALGAQLEDGFPFPDHHIFSEDDLNQLAQFARERGARLITTEKDAARLSADWRARVAVLPVEARFADEPALDALLAPICARM